MRMRISAWTVAGALVCGCSQVSDPQAAFGIDPATARPAAAAAAKDKVVTKEQEAEIRALVEQLVFADGEAQNRPVINPGIIVHDAKGKARGQLAQNRDQVAQNRGQAHDPEEYRERFERCAAAFTKLSALKSAAFPILVEHLSDKWQSINFRNHHLGNSVGNACYWNIYYQLQDKPDNYSEYGYSRVGRDGKPHPKPYWAGTPFDAAGGVKEWLEQNKNLSYPHMQVKCLTWLLDKEKAIGAPDAESYFLNILPLEIRILERRQDAGENVAEELDKLRTVLKNKDVQHIPAELLPGK